MIPAWEDEYRRPFLVNGMNVLEILSGVMEDSGKENRKVMYNIYLVMSNKDI